MRFCEECGAQLEDDAVFCEECGTRVEPLLMVAASEVADINENTCSENLKKENHQSVETVVEPTTEQAVEPTREPIVEPKTESVTELSAESEEEQLTDPKAENMIEPVTVSVAEPVIELVDEPIVEPVAESVVEHIAETETVLATEHEAETENEQITEQVSEHEAENEQVAKTISEHKAETITETVTEPVTELADEPAIQKSNETQANTDKNTGKPGKEKKKTHRILIIAASVSAFVLVLIGALYFFVLRDKLGKGTADSEIALEDTENQTEDIQTVVNDKENQSADTQTVVTDKENQMSDSQNSATGIQVAESESSDELTDESTILANLDLGAGTDEKTFFDNLNLNYDYNINKHQIYGGEDGNVTFFGYPDADDPKVIKLKSEYNKKNVTIVGYSALGGRENLLVVVIPVGYSRIEDNAFIASQKLLAVFIPSTVTYISETAFDYDYNVSIYCVSGSYAETYAEEQGINCILLSCTEDYTSNENTAVNTGIIPGLVATDAYASQDEKLRQNLKYTALDRWTSADENWPKTYLFELLDNLACCYHDRVTDESELNLILGGNPESLINFHGVGHYSEINSFAYVPFNDITYEEYGEGYIYRPVSDIQYITYSMLGYEVDLTTASNATVVDYNGMTCFRGDLGMCGLMGEIYYVHDVSNIDYMGNNTWKVTASIYCGYDYIDISDYTGEYYTDRNFLVQSNSDSMYGFNVIGIAD